MMANADVASPVLSGKRKRSEISYRADDYFDSLEIEDDQVDDTESNGKRKKVAKAKGTSDKNMKPNPTATKKQKPFRFLDLPAELRDMVYEFALVEPKGITLINRTINSRQGVARGPIYIEENDYYAGKPRPHRWWHRSGKQEVEHTKDRSLVPALLGVNKQLREEAGGYLYKQELIFQDTTTLHSFLATIGHHNRGLLSEITVRGWHAGGTFKAYNFAALAAMQDCVNLDSLYFDCSIGYWMNPIKLARQMYKHAFFFLEPYSAVNGLDSAVQVVQFGEWHFDKARTSRFSTRCSDPEFDAAKRDEYHNEMRRMLVRNSGLIEEDLDDEDEEEGDAES